MYFWDSVGFVLVLNWEEKSFNLGAKWLHLVQICGTIMVQRRKRGQKDYG